MKACPGPEHVSHVQHPHSAPDVASIDKIPSVKGSDQDRLIPDHSMSRHDETGCSLDIAASVRPLTVELSAQSSPYSQASMVSKQSPSSIPCLDILSAIFCLPSPVCRGIFDVSCLLACVVSSVSQPQPFHGDGSICFAGRLRRIQSLLYIIIVQSRASWRSLYL